jgi:hypothetical protein
MAKAAENDPHETHKARLSALYVDVDSQGKWNRPADLGAEESGEIISQIADYYARILGHLNVANLGNPWEELRQGLAKWSGAPELPPATFPDLAGYWNRSHAPPVS